MSVFNAYKKSQWSPLQKAFSHAVTSVSRPAPVIRKGFLIRSRGDVTFMLHFKPEDTIGLAEIESQLPGRGQGGAVLNWLCTLADTHRQTLRLTAVPYREGNMHALNTSDKLMDWYGKRGFVRYAGFFMVRAPQ